MRTWLWLRFLAAAVAVGVLGASAGAADVLFATNGPNGLMGMASRPSSAFGAEIETGDDFILNQNSTITNVSFTGLLTGTTSVGDVRQVVVEVYRIFPQDSTVPPSGDVPTRVNSPSDVAFASRDSAASGLTYSASLLSSSFTVGNSVLNGIHKFPNQTTGGDGPATGVEATISANLSTPITLDAGHYFLIAQVLMANANEQFYWLSAPKPIIPPGTQFTPDLQTWIRNDALDPDWLRVGSDIVGGTTPPTFNASFSLSGQAVPEPSSLALAAIAAFGGSSAIADVVNNVSPASARAPIRPARGRRPSRVVRPMSGCSPMAGFDLGIPQMLNGWWGFTQCVWEAPDRRGGHEVFFGR